MLKYQIFMKIRPVGADLFHADGRTEMSKLRVAFHGLANELKKHLKYINTCNFIYKKVQKLHNALFSPQNMANLYLNWKYHEVRLMEDEKPWKLNFSAG
jgi:hypothetical protein